MLDQIDKDQKEIKEKEETLKDSRGKLTNYTLVKDGV